MNVKELVYVFLRKSLIGQDVDFKNSNSVLQGCISLAYDDMMTAGRFVSKGRWAKDNLLDSFSSVLEKHGFAFSRSLIDDCLPLFGIEEKIIVNGKIKNGKSKKGKPFTKEATRFGLSQKLVNMSFKYFLVFSDLLSSHHIKFENLDCPIDSIILKSIYGENGKDKKIIWSKISKEEYFSCQATIKDILSKDSNVSGNMELKALGNIVYDFEEWGRTND